MDKRILANIAKHEGRRLSLYLDTKDVVTIGVGHAVFTSADAAKLKMWIGSNMPATQQAVIQDWLLVKQGTIKQGRLTMLAEDVDALLEKDLGRFTQVLNNEFPEMGSYPVDAQVAMYDIAFECGSIAPSNWPRLNAAIKARDWVSASQHCERGACSKKRNDDTIAQFLAAAGSLDA